MTTLEDVIETDDGAEVLFDYRGCGLDYPVGRRQIVASTTHLSEDERYRWLNDSLSVGAGEIRSHEDGPTELVIEWAELVGETVSDQLRDAGEARETTPARPGSTAY